MTTEKQQCIRCDRWVPVDQWDATSCECKRCRGISFDEMAEIAEDPLYAPENIPACFATEEDMEDAEEEEYEALRRKRTKEINRLQKLHPGTRRQRTSHGAGKYSVQFFDKETGKLVADYNLP